MQEKLFIKKIFLLLVPVVMLCSFLLEYSHIDVEAATSRNIKIEEVHGTVMIQKNGGVKLIRAYEGMILQQGDRITTNAYSSLKLVIQDTKDEITIGEKAEFFIANLDLAKGNKRTKLTIWNGSIWAKVTPLVNSKDTFEIGTSSSTMNVRGTNFWVGVDPNTGEPSLVVGSGTVNVSPNNQGGGVSIPVYPSQQVVGDGSIQSHTGNPNIVDLDSLIGNMSPAIIEAIIRSKAAIDKENDAYISSLQQGQQVNQEDLDRLKLNLQNLIGNIVNTAIQTNKVNEENIRELIKKMNEQYNVNLDLDKTIPLQLSYVEKEKQAQLQKLAKEKRKQAEEEKRKLEELNNQNQSLVNKLQELLKKQQEQKEKAQEEERQKAEEALKRKLDEAGKLALEQRLKALELERQNQDRAALEDQVKVNNPVPTPSQPSENPAPNPNPEPGPGPGPSTIDRNLAKAKATIPAFSEHYTAESWSQIVFVLGMGEASNSEKIEKTEAIKSAVSGLITIVDYNLTYAKSTIPTNSTLFTPEIWERVLAALALAETNDGEKIVKTKTIKLAVEGLIEIPITPDLVVETPEVGTNYVKVHWAHYVNASKYEIYLNGELVREYDTIMDSYNFITDELKPGKSYTLEILALEENANILAKKTIDFQTDDPPVDVVPTP